jgi:hypothetical protein
MSGSLQIDSAAGSRRGVKLPDVGRSAGTPDGRLNSLAIVREEFPVFRPTAPIGGWTR